MNERIEWRYCVEPAKDEIPQPEVCDYQEAKNAEEMKRAFLFHSRFTVYTVVYFGYLTGGGDFNGKTKAAILFTIQLSGRFRNCRRSARSVSGVQQH